MRGGRADPAVGARCRGGRLAPARRGGCRERPGAGIGIDRVFFFARNLIPDGSTRPVWMHPVWMHPVRMYPVRMH
jgi:hypothetical protein